METSLVSDISWAMERQEVTALTALDLCVAFDSSNHEILIDVLEHQLGITNSALNWFKTYLYPRRFIVDVGGHHFREIDLRFFIPQGSLAGPVLYLAYASTLRYVILDTSMINLNGYADDHFLNKNFRADNRIEENSAIKSLEACMDDIKDWMDRNRLKMNAMKTEFIIFRTITFLLSQNIVLVAIDKLSHSLSTSSGLRTTKQQCPYMYIYIHICTL